MKNLHLILAAILILGLVFVTSCDKEQKQSNLKAVSDYANSKGIAPLVDTAQAKARDKKNAYLKLTSEKLAKCQEFSNRYTVAEEMSDFNNPDNGLVWYCGYSYEVMYYFVNCGKNYAGHMIITKRAWHFLKGLQKGTRSEWAVDDYDTPPEWDCQLNGDPE